MSSENQAASVSSPKKVTVSDALASTDLAEVLQMANVLIRQEQEEFNASIENATATLTNGSGEISLNNEGMDSDLAGYFNAFGGNIQMQQLMQTRQLIRTMSRAQIMLQAIGAHLVKMDAPATAAEAAAAAEATAAQAAAPAAEPTPVS